MLAIPAALMPHMGNCTAVRVLVQAQNEGMDNTKDIKMSQSSVCRAARVRYLARNRSTTKVTGKIMQQIMVAHRLACRLSDA